MNRFLLAWRYLEYYFTSQNKHDVHSPFVFSLLTEVIHGKTNDDEIKKIEVLWKGLKKNKSTILVQDFGARNAGAAIEKRICDIANTSAKSKKYAALLYRLIKHFSPEVMIELGTSLGISATYQSAANPNGKLFTLEGSENIADIAEKNFNTLGFKNIFLQRGEFSLSLPKVLNENKKIDYVFFDGNHRQQATLDYFNLCLNHTNEKTFFVFDDINWSNEMQNAWKIICNHPSVTVSIDLFMMGIIFFDKSLSKQHFKLRF